MKLDPVVYRIQSEASGTVIGTLSHVEGSAWWRAEWIPPHNPLMLREEPLIRYFDGRYAAEQFFTRENEGQ